MSPLLIAGVMEHVACYLQSGSAQAAHRAVLLLQRLALDSETDQALRAHAEDLAEAILNQDKALT